MSPRRHNILPPEVDRPVGELGVRPYQWWKHRPPPDLGDVLAVRTRPWILCLWEPLAFKLPGPNLVQPYCCYAQTVIFYARPFQELPPKRYLSRLEHQGRYYANGNPILERLERPIIKRDRTGTLAEYGRVETRLTFDDHVAFDGETWHIHGGTVRWCRPRWWMQRWARRMPAGGGCRVCETFEREQAGAQGTVDA